MALPLAPPFVGSPPPPLSHTPPTALPAAGPLTGSLINPARTLGPTLVFGLPAATSALYVAAQFVGAALAAFAARWLYGCDTADTAMAEAAVIDEGEAKAA